VSNGGEGRVKELIMRKIVGLFHDPPWKPWVISGEIKRDSFRCNGEIPVIDFGGRSHENQGLTVAMKILDVSKDEMKKLKDYVHDSDVLSAALDRYLNAQPETTKQEEKANILDPELTYPLEKVPSKIDEFVCEIIETSEKLKKEGADLTLLYNYLYGNIELTWYKYNDKALPLADTRVKTYSVFDHLYSTVSLLNWFDGKAFEGYLVKVDIPGVQDIISRSRKIYDLWGGSWLVSALLFFTILPFIEQYGADVVLSPFMGLNPFFHSYLRSKLGKNEKLDYMKEYDATQPVMPATAFLALPKDVNDIEGKVKEYYLNAWKTIIDEVVNSGKVDDKVKEELKEGIEKYPIVPIRVSAVKVKIEGKEEKELVKEFDKLFRTWEEFGQPTATVKFSYGIPAYPIVKEVSEKLYEKKMLYKQCTNCGVLPAFIWREGGKVEVYKRKEDKEVDVSNENDLEDGEALCYYCYLRRKLHHAKFDILEKELGVIPSTIDLANLDKWKEIMECERKKEVKESSPLNIRLPSPLDEYNRYDNCKTAWYNYSVLGRFFVEKVEDRNYEVEDDCLNSIKDINLYYAIVKGDGDFIGKRVWKGIIKTTLEDYIKKTRVKVDEKKLNDFKENFRNYLFNTYKCQKPESDTCKNIDNIIPITPDYLIAISRSLMLVALQDIDTVSKYGVVVYAGGDDIAFLSPLKIPVKDQGKEIRNSAIGLVKLTRRNYSGALPGEESQMRGFFYFKNGIFDLPALYGRSYSVFITHYKDPFYSMWDIASRLEEMKDEAETGEKKGKDFTFVLGGRGMLNLEDAAILENKIGTFEAIEALYGNIGKALSKSFIKDYLSAYEEVKDSNSVDLNEYLNKLLDYVIERNKKGKRDQIMKDLDNLRKLKGESNIDKEKLRKVYDLRVEVVKAYDYLEE